MRIRLVLDDERNNYMREEGLLNDNSPIIVIADEPGMGKSTTLMNMAEMTKKSNPLLWVIKIDLNQHQKTLEERVESLEDLSQDDLMDLLSTVHGEFTDSLTRKILKYKLNRPGQVLFLCDGFDEVKLERHEAVLNVLRFLRRETDAKICITTRSYCKEKLEENLSVLVHMFQPIDEEQQNNFLSHLWKQALKLTTNTDLSVLEEYAKKIIKKLDCILDDQHARSDFISVPLRARMLAEIFRETIENALRGDETAVKCINSTEKVSIGNLYDQFIQRKYKIYLHEKIMRHEDEGSNEGLEDLMDSYYTEIYGVLAVEKLFDCKIAEAPNIYNKKKFSISMLSQIGLIQGNNAAYDFIHRTFAEYFAGRWLAVACQTSNARKIICEKLLMKEYKVPRYFFDYFMSEGISLHRAVLQGDETEFSKFLIENTDVSHKDNLGRTALHLAAQECRLKMIEVLKERGLGLVADETGKTPLHYAADSDFVTVIEGISSRVRTHVDALLENIDNNISLDDHIFQSPLHVDTETVYTSIFEKSVCDQSMLVKTVNERDGAKKSAVEYAAEHHYWGTACIFVLHGADISCLTEEPKKELKELFLYAAEKTHRTYSKDYHPLRPVVGLLAIQVPEAVQDFSDTYEYPRLLSYFFANGHTKVVDSLMRSIQNKERRERIVNARDNDYLPLTRLASNYDLILSDEEYKNIIEYYDTIGREELCMRIELADINDLLSRAAGEGFVRSFRYLYELSAREQNEEVFNRDFLEKNASIINSLYCNVQDLRYDDEWFQNFTSECFSYFGWNQLHFVAINKFVDSNEELSNLSFDDLKTEDKYGNTPLFYACSVGRGSTFIESLFSALEERHLDKDQIYEIIHTVNEWGATPLHFVISNRFLESTKALLSNMLRIGFEKTQLISILTHQDNEGGTPMCDTRGGEFVKLFMTYLKKFDFSSEECIQILKSCEILLHKLIHSGFYIEAEIFLTGIENLPLDEDQRAAVVNWPSKDDRYHRNTPLHAAAEEGYCYDVVLRLFRNGAIFNALNSSQELPLDLIRNKLRRGSDYEKTYFVLDSISTLFKLVEDQNQPINQNSEKLDQFKKIISEIEDKPWIDPKSILNARNSDNQTLRDVEDTAIRDLLQEYEQKSSNTGVRYSSRL